MKLVGILSGLTLAVASLVGVVGLAGCGGGGSSSAASVPSDPPVVSANVTLFAGATGGYGTADGTGTAARFYDPYAITTDSSGNVYVADRQKHTIRKITPAGVTTTLAGMAGQSGSADGSASAARFNEPSGLATDSSGNVYVADSYNNTIRKISPAGVVSTVAGIATQSGSANGAASAATFNYPSALTVDASSNIYVADSGNSAIRKISSDGVVTTLAGVIDGVSGYADGVATVARFGHPYGLAMDSKGNLYVTDLLYRTVRKVTPAGDVSTLAGTPTPPSIFDPSPNNPIIPADGTGGAAVFGKLNGVATDSSDNVYVLERSPSNLRKVTQAGVVTTVAKLGATFTGGDILTMYSEGLAIDKSGTMYVSATSRTCILKVIPDDSGATDGSASLFAGTSRQIGSADGLGSVARFNNPYALSADTSGNLYVADTSNHTIRMVNSSGMVTTLAGTAGIAGSTDDVGAQARFNYPSALATAANGDTYIADTNNHTIRKLTSKGVVTTLAGTAGVSASGDGLGNGAGFTNPMGIVVNAAGVVYVADTYNNMIRKIATDGTVTTLAGKVGTFGYADGKGAEARFNSPRGMVLDASGNLYVCDSYNHSIRKVTPDGTVTTLAGLSGVPGNADGSGLNAQFHSPMAITIDSSANLYVADQYNGTIRKVTLDGVVTTLHPTHDATVPEGIRYPTALTWSNGKLYIQTDDSIMVMIFAS